MLRSWIQNGIRSVHIAGFRKSLPHRLGIYFHELTREQHEPFRQAIRQLRDKGYRIANDPTDFLAGSDPVAWVSFDDCFRDWYVARPLFDELDIRATFYTNTAPIRDVASEDVIEDYCLDALRLPNVKPTLSTGEIQVLHADGHTIGAHTHSHSVLSELPHDEALADIQMGRQRLEEVIGEPVEHFAYPYGMRRFLTENLMQSCREMGFKSVARAIPAMQHTQQGPFELHRSGWDLSVSAEENLKLLSVDGRAFERLTGRSAIG